MVYLLVLYSVDDVCLCYTVVAPSLVAASGVVLKLSVDFTVLACNVDALPTDGAEELPVRGVGWLVCLGCKVVRVAFGSTVLTRK